MAAKLLLFDPWLYENKPLYKLQDLHDYERYIGFVYKITDKQTGKFYIGKKVFQNNTRQKIGKREKAETKTRKTFKQISKESNWASYFGSSKELLEDVKNLGYSRFRREILVLCCTKKFMNFCELSYQITEGVLHTDQSYNHNILGKYYRRDMQNCPVDNQNNNPLEKTQHAV